MRPHVWVEPLQDGSLTFAAVDFETQKSVPMPAELKDKMIAYKTACEAGG